MGNVTVTTGGEGRGRLRYERKFVPLLSFLMKRERERYERIYLILF